MTNMALLVSWIVALVGLFLLAGPTGSPSRVHAQERGDAPVGLARRGPGDVDGRDDLLEEIKRRGYLRCGVRSVDLPGFLVRPPDGRPIGFDADYCRGVAAALFADGDSIQYLPFTSDDRFRSVRDGLADVFIGGATETLSRDAAVEDGGAGVNFSPTMFHDGQSFLIGTAITTNPDADPAALLDGKTVCVRSNTTSETNLRDFAADRGLTIVVFTEASPGSSGDPTGDFEGGRCDALTSDRSVLFSRRPGLTRPSTLMSATISKEPLAAVVGTGADRERLEHVVRWVIYATFAAEELHIESGNVGVVPSTGEGRRLLGYAPGLGEKLGLGNDWALQVIRLVGNYREIYARNLPGLPRGKNVGPSAGGLLFSPPFQ